MLNSYTFALFKINIKSLDSTMREKSLHTLYSQKKIFSSKKSQEYSFFT